MIKVSKFLTFLIFVFLFIVNINTTKAATCGGAVVCVCGDTVTSDYTLNADLDCSTIVSNGLIVGANNIIINGNNHIIKGKNERGIMGNGIDNNLSYSGVTIKNFKNITNFWFGINLNNSLNNSIENNIIKYNYAGIYVSGGTNVEILGNTLNGNGDGIHLEYSDNGFLEDNVISSNYRGIYILNSTNQVITSVNTNYIFNNAISVFEIHKPNFYVGNYFFYNKNDKTLTFTDPTSTTTLNSVVTSTISIFDANGNSCPSCTYTITTSPIESLATNKLGNIATSTFVVTRPGIYSLMYTITDTNNNVTKRDFSFFVNANGVKTTRYYLRGISPTTNGQPLGNGHDSKIMLLTPPSVIEDWDCSDWVQNAPDEIPDYPLASIYDIDINTWYKYSIDDVQYIGLQRFSDYSTEVNLSNGTSFFEDYTWTNTTFDNINWSMNYPKDWYLLSIKLRGNGVYEMTIPEQPSYADFTYQYTTTPAIKSISNENIIVLSATAPADDTSSATIVLDNPNTSATSTTLVLTDFKRPFLNSTSTIDSTSTTTLTTSIGSSTSSTLSAVALDIIPDTGSVSVNIDTWNTTSSYYKKWTEEGSDHDISTSHIVGDLKVNTTYVIKINGVASSWHNSNSSGEITFTYDGGYSAKEFEVIEDSSSPEVSIDSIQDLYNIRNSYNGNYIQTTNLDFQDNLSYDETIPNGYSSVEEFKTAMTRGDGWLPIGNFDNAFIGTFDGNGYKIKNLFIDSDSYYLGLFGITSNINLTNIALEDINITGTNYVGGLAGNNDDGIISNSYVTGTINGISDIGGLVSNDFGTITNSYANVNINGTGNNIGGLVGYTESATITNSYAKGNITGVTYVGGLVGLMDGVINNSYATGNVTAEGDLIGGLIGYNMATITNSYATGDVTGPGNSVGGLVGLNQSSISKSYSTGNVSGTTNGYDGGIGGLVGWNSGGIITNSYATGDVLETGEIEYGFIGGLVGLNENSSITNTYAIGSVDGIDFASEFVGGLVGYNSDSVITNSYYNTQTSGRSDEDIRGILRTTAEMTYPYDESSRTTYDGWDFDTIWHDDIYGHINNGYPFYYFIADTTPPVITITGSNPLQTYKGESYYDEGSSATDNIDGNLTSNIDVTSNVDMNTVGAYSIIYVVTDTAGNTSTSTRVVNVLTRPSTGSTGGGWSGDNNTNTDDTNTDDTNTDNNNQNNDNAVHNSNLTWTTGLWVKTSDSSTVYFVDSDNNRHAYPYESIWRSYFNNNFSFVSIITKEELASYKLTKNVPYNTGTLIKMPTVSKVYVVDKDGVLHWIISEDVATRLYGSSWNKLVHDLNEVFFSDYTVGSDII